MPRYHFNIDDRLSDDEGTKLPDLKTAMYEAVKMAGQIIGDEAPTFWETAVFVMTLTDNNGLTLFNLMMVGTMSAGSVEA